MQNMFCLNTKHKHKCFKANSSIVVKRVISIFDYIAKINSNRSYTFEIVSNKRWVKTICTLFFLPQLFTSSMIDSD